ncbi:MAG: hypothetical protein HY927_15080 [Elusimicrobia bacterium]|nr:hypothetical protein [Elusimicrobiota bacterium]
MKTNALLSLILPVAASMLCPADAWTQAALRMPEFERVLVEIPKPALTSLQDLCRTLWTSRDTKEILDTLLAIEGWTRPVSQEDEMLVVQSLRVVADNPVVDASARARAVYTLGKVCERVSSDINLRDAVAFLVDIVNADNPMDKRRDLRRPALMGLARAAHLVPDSYRDLIEATLKAALRVIRDNADASENVLAMTILQQHLRHHGVAHLFQSYELQGSVLAELISPYEANLYALYGDRNRPVDFRYQLIRVLGTLGRVRPDGGVNQIPHRAMQVLKNMENNEPDGQLKMLIRLYTSRARF